MSGVGHGRQSGCALQVGTGRSWPWPQPLHGGPARAEGVEELLRVPAGGHEMRAVAGRKGQPSARGYQLSIAQNKCAR